MGARVTAMEYANAIAKATGVDVMVGFAIEDPEDGGVFIEAGYTLAVEDAEYLAATILRDIRRHMEAEPHPCPSCEKRAVRVEMALAALERDGSKPSGKVRPAVQ